MQRRKTDIMTWLHYDWGFLVVIAIVISVIVQGVIGHFQIGKTIPDYQFAYVGKDSLPDDTVNAFCILIDSLGEDLNGDGKVVTVLNQYPYSSAGDDSKDAEYASYASQVKLIADIDSCDSYFFLLDDPEKFQSDYEVLAGSDAENPAVYAWSSCPSVSAADLGQYSETILGKTVSGSSNDLLSHLWLSRRSFDTKKTVKYRTGCDELWKRLIEGAEA